MLENNENMGKLRQKLLDEAAGERTTREARKQRNLKRFGEEGAGSKVAGAGEGEERDVGAG